jgi:hypothetical protein
MVQITRGGQPFWMAVSNYQDRFLLVYQFYFILRGLLPVLPASWFEPVYVLLICLITAGGALAVSILLMCIPVASRLVGRSTSPGKRHARSIEPSQTTNFREARG